jgi:hypothetical protein
LEIESGEGRYREEEVCSIRREGDRRSYIAELHKNTRLKEEAAE